MCALICLSCALHCLFCGIVSAWYGRCSPNKNTASLTLYPWMSYTFLSFAVKKSHSSMTHVHLEGHGVARAACLFLYNRRGQCKQIFLVATTFIVAPCEDFSLVIAVYSISPPPFTKLCLGVCFLETRVSSLLHF